MVQTSLAAFFTPQPQRQIGKLGLGGGAPATAAPGRKIAPLPRSIAPLAPLALKSRLPTRTTAAPPRVPPAPKITVPVPFGGRVGESTQASLMKSVATRTETRPVEKEAAAIVPILEATMDVDSEEFPSQASAVVDLPPPPTMPAATAVTATTTGQVAPKGLPPRRPTSRPITHPSTSESTETSIAGRQPSYPSSLGSGPLVRSTNRVVSNPFPSPSSESMDVDESALPPSPRSQRITSAPSALPAAPLSSPTKRSRTSEDTVRRLSALSEAMAGLNLPTSARATDTVRPARPSRPPTPALTSTTEVSPRPRNLSSRPPLASVGVNVARIHPKANVGKDHKGSLAPLLKTTSKLFKGVVAFVDVHNEDGSDGGSSFVEMLRNAGARVRHRL